MRTATTIKGKRVIEVEEYDELKLEARIDVAEGGVEILYMPKTVELQLWVDGMMVRSIPARLGEATKLSLKIEHSWFIFDKRYVKLSAVYPGGDPIVVKRKKWRRIGRLGWLSEYESREELSKSADSMILILGKSNAYKLRDDIKRHGLGRGK